MELLTRPDVPSQNPSRPHCSFISKYYYIGSISFVSVSFLINFFKGEIKESAVTWLSYVAFFGQFSKYCFAIGSSRSKARKCRSAGYSSLMGRLCFHKKWTTLINFETNIDICFLMNTTGTQQGFINSSGSYCQNGIGVRFRFCMVS